MEKAQTQTPSKPKPTSPAQQPKSSQPNQTPAAQLFSASGPPPPFPFPQPAGQPSEPAARSPRFPARPAGRPTPRHRSARTTNAPQHAPRLTALAHLQTLLPRSLRVLTGQAEITAVISGGSLPSRAPGSRALSLNRHADPLPPIPRASAAYNPSRCSPPRSKRSRAPCATAAALLCCPPAPPEQRRGLASTPGATPRPPRTTPAPATAGISTGAPPR